MTVPFSRTVNVTVSKNTGFVSQRGFGVPLFLTSQAVAGVLDADNLTKLYGSIQEVAVDFDAADEFHRAATIAFSQNPRPLQIKAGFYPRDPAAAPTAQDMKDALDAIADADDAFYFICVESQLRDTPGADGVIEWTEARTKLLLLDSNDELHQDATDTTNISARYKGSVTRTGVFYHTDPATYGAMGLASFMATRNFDQANSAYTAKFKRINGLNNVNLGSAAIQAITSFVPQAGQDEAQGHNANTYIDIGGRNFVVEGSTLTADFFLDEIHACDWIQFRTEEALLNILLNNAVVPMTDPGMQLLASAPRSVTEQARRAGFVDIDREDEDGNNQPGVIITVPSVFDIPESQRKSRIPPAISVSTRYTGGVHYGTVHYSVNF